MHSRLQTTQQRLQRQQPHLLRVAAMCSTAAAVQCKGSNSRNDSSFGSGSSSSPLKTATCGGSSCKDRRHAALLAESAQVRAFKSCCQCRQRLTVAAQVAAVCNAAAARHVAEPPQADHANTAPPPPLPLNCRKWGACGACGTTMAMTRRQGLHEERSQTIIRWSGVRTDIEHPLSAEKQAKQSANRLFSPYHSDATPPSLASRGLTRL
jgi:hypothetical protein